VKEHKKVVEKPAQIRSKKSGSMHKKAPIPSFHKRQGVTALTKMQPQHHSSINLPTSTGVPKLGANKTGKKMFLKPKDRTNKLTEASSQPQMATLKKSTAIKASMKDLRATKKTFKHKKHESSSGVLSAANHLSLYLQQ